MSLFSSRSRAGADEPPHFPMHVLLVLATLYAIYPVLWVLSIAFSGKQSLAIADVPSNPTFWDRLRAVIPWPADISLSNFTSVFADQPFSTWILNSAIVSIATTILGVFLACTAAYAFSRFRFPGRQTGMMSFLVSQMFPGTLMLIPLYIILVKWLGLGSTRTGLVLAYSTTAIPFCVWMLKGYFDTIPRDLEEAALIDGASPATIFWRIVLPLAKPAVAVTALFSFMTGWNEFILAATLIDKESMYTAPVGLRFFVGGFSQQWGFFAAGAVIVSIPVVALFLYLQKYLVSGLTAGSVKG
ncbi:MAG TPA: sugar ABC transporter permease [Thermoanaerobaculia bacterium]|nr:sugar ABC transporter permease [Thermoanaerobaculia bacterium]